MAQVKLGDVAVESRETCKGDKSGMPIVGLEHITPGEVTLSNWDTDTDNTFTKRFRKGDMLFGRRRAYLKKAAQAPFDGICSGDITVIRAKEDLLLPELLPFIIQNDNLFDFAVGKSAGSLSPRVKWDNLKNYTFELPSMEEQRKLAEVLWSINDTLQTYQNLLTQTDALVQAQFVEMFDNTDYPEKSGKELFKFSSGKFLPEEKRKEDGIPVYGGNGIAWYTDESLVNEDTIIIGRVGAYCGNVRLAKGKKWITDNAIYISKFKTQDFSLEFLENMMRLHNYHQYAGVAAQPKITQKPLEEARFVIPPIAVQKEFSGFASQVEKSKSTLQNTITSLQTTKRCILENALGTGRKE